ncbi:hypothetical protein J1614_006207 [Plenodomus biglobosus]|nr:hypothetical protein J1614_006207 [Plenodomus biglobosus]
MGYSTCPTEPPSDNIPHSGGAEGMNVMDIDMLICISWRDAEGNYKVRGDIANEGWHYDHGHVRSKL